MAGPQEMIYHYSDGSGNAWILDENGTLSYEPVTTITSSSGTYSGGEPKTLELSSEQHSQLHALFNAALTNKLFLVEKRSLGSAQIRKLAQGSEPLTAIIAMRSPDKKRIEAYLASLFPAP